MSFWGKTRRICFLAQGKKSDVILPFDAYEAAAG